jgi:hypothetical protein
MAITPDELTLASAIKALEALRNDQDRNIKEVKAKNKKGWRASEIAMALTHYEFSKTALTMGINALRREKERDPT